MNFELMAEWAGGLAVTLVAVLSVIYALIVLCDYAEWKNQRRMK